MKFEELHQGIHSMTDNERRSFLLSYFEKREVDLLSVPVKKTKDKTEPPLRRKSKLKDKSISVTPEELALLKKLGLI